MTVVVDNDGQEHCRHLQEEVQGRLEPRQPYRQADDDDSRDLRTVDMEHIVSELQDQGCCESECGCGKDEQRGVPGVSAEHPAIEDAVTEVGNDKEGKRVKYHPEGIQPGVLDDVRVDTILVVAFLEDLLVVDVRKRRQEALNHDQDMPKADRKAVLAGF